ncbi:vWA domain-containing protein [Candidatus Chloroploca sp. Khr17]|uniref:VWA domain-containing protein n=1 Tax=Candidatus Chloroploca sp. Khr17 TaxID=2496869 RepID=UPI00101D69ED|nr:vWA domain-containing protein [Candidatus Chloroploca sp. Khr17]
MGTLIAQETAVFHTPIPWLLGICFDCTISISERDFATAKREVCNFLHNVNYRARLLPGQPSDFISVTAFKENHNIFGPAKPLNITKMDRTGHVEALCNWIQNLRRDGSRTALYDAIAIASRELATLDAQLPYRYLKVVLAITDGEDNDSRLKLADLGYFHTTSQHLAVVGVGNGANRELRQLGQYATSVHAISRFEDLFKAITISVSTVIQRTQHIAW